MAKNKQQKKRPRIKPGYGPDLVVLAGLPKHTSGWIRDLLTQDPSRTSAIFFSVASKDHDYSDLYRAGPITAIREILDASVREDNVQWRFPPRRLIVLYAPSKDLELLVSDLGFICHLQRLAPKTVDPKSYSEISWRHDENSVKEAVYNGLDKALDATDQLKREITDRRISPLALPARNFYFPDRDSTINNTYQEFIRGQITLTQMLQSIKPKKFMRGELSGKAFKGSKPGDMFYQDARKRVFPPDGHALSRYPGTDAARVLEQRYRFGVVVGDGDRHYDVQFESPRELQQEPMYCADAGEVSVTGSHANVGVNDVIWTPDGTKVQRSALK